MEDINSGAHIIEYLSEQLTLEQKEAISNLIDTAFGCGGYGRDVFEQIAATRAPVIIVTWEGDLPVAFGFAFMALPDSLKSLLQDLPSDLSVELSHANTVGKIGVLKTVCTSPLHQGKGLGTRMIAAMSDTLTQRGAQELIVPCWELNDTINLARALTRNAFVAFTRTPLYWRSECDSGHFKCIGRTDRCTCHSVFYGKTCEPDLQKCHLV